MTDTAPKDALHPGFWQAWTTLTALTFQEALGERCLQAAALVALGISALSLSVSEVAIFAHERVLVDGVLTATTLLPLCFTAATAQVLMGRDVGLRAASPLLSHPLSSSLWLLGRFSGLWCALGAQIAVMALIFLPVLWGAGLTSWATWTWSLLLIWVECTVALSIAMAARCLARPAMAAVVTLVLVGAGYLTLPPGDLRDTPRAQAMPLYRAAQAALPQMQRINLRAEAARGAPAPEGFVGYAVVYGLGYSMAMLSLGSCALGLRRRRCA